jgi:hypothetical protein
VIERIGPRDDLGQATVLSIEPIHEAIASMAEPIGPIELPIASIVDSIGRVEEPTDSTAETIGPRESVLASMEKAIDPIDSAIGSIEKALDPIGRSSGPPKSSLGTVVSTMHWIWGLLAPLFYAIRSAEKPRHRDRSPIGPLRTPLENKTTSSQKNHPAVGSLFPM